MLFDHTQAGCPPEAAFLEIMVSFCRSTSRSPAGWRDLACRHPSGASAQAIEKRGEKHVIFSPFARDGDGNIKPGGGEQQQPSFLRKCGIRDLG